MEEENKLVLPVVHDRCPVCGSTVRLAEAYIKQCIGDGSLPQGIFGGEGMMFRIPLIDPQHPPVIMSTRMMVKILLIQWDVCGGKDGSPCGNIYCTRLEVNERPADIQMQVNRPVDTTKH